MNKRDILLLLLLLPLFSIGQNTFPSSGNVGIGTAYPQALLDVGNVAVDTLETVLGRLPEGNSVGMGTYLGVRGFNTNLTGGNPTASFSLEHRFYGQLNSAINFYRGGSFQGGFITFATNNGTEQMRIDQNGNVGIGLTNPANRLEIVQTNTFLLSDPNSYAFGIGQNGGYLGIGGYGVGAVLQSFNTLPLFINPIGNKTILNGSSTYNVLIGETTQVNNAYRLDVNGAIRATGLTVNATGADFVFDSSYHLTALPVLEKYIQLNHHLPENASAIKMRTEGLNIGENQIKLLQKVEELTLFVIDADKRIKQQNCTIILQQQQLQQEHNHNDTEQQLLLQLQGQFKIQQQEVDRLKQRIKG